MYACCLNCGTETAHVSYKTPEERLEAARQAAYLWNIGKVLTDTPNDNMKGEGGSLSALLAKMADIIEDSRSTLPAWVV